MRKEYDFTNAKKRPEIARKLGAKKPVTIRLDEAVVDYFKAMAEEMDESYQALINAFLRSCVAKEMRPTGEWKTADDALGGASVVREG